MERRRSARIGIVPSKLFSTVLLKYDKGCQERIPMLRKDSLKQWTVLSYPQALQEMNHAAIEE
jgi:hypothetical protein